LVDVKNCLDISLIFTQLIYSCLIINEWYECSVRLLKMNAEGKNAYARDLIHQIKLMNSMIVVMQEGGGIYLFQNLHIPKNKN